MSRTRNFSVLLSLVAVSILISGCSTSGDTNRAAAGLDGVGNVKDCGSHLIGDRDRYEVQVKNMSSQRIILADTEVDCYDWFGLENPTKFNVDLAPGMDSATETLAMRGIPQYGGVIRPWNWNVQVNEPGIGFVIEGSPQSRPTIAWAGQSCHTGYSITACTGATLCADDPAGEKVVTKVPLRSRITGTESSLTMTTLCSGTAPTAKIIFTD